MSPPRDLEEPSGSYRRKVAPLSILVVDDDEVDREIVRRLLAKAEIPATITEAAEPMAALAMLRHAAFDLVVLDYSFPRHDGLFVLRELREASSQVPVILLTGQDDTALAVELMRSGATDYIAKSGLTAQRLSASVRNALRIRASETATRALQEAWRANDELVRALFEASGEAIVVLDLDGRLLLTSPVALRQLDAADSAAVRGQPWVESWAAEHHHAAVAAMAEARASRTGRFVGRSRGGPAQWWEVVVSALRDADAKAERLLAVARRIEAPAR